MAPIRLAEVAPLLDDARIAIIVWREIPWWLICGEVRRQSRFG